MSDLEAEVQRLIPHRVSRHTHLCAEHFKQWQREAYPREQSKTPPTEGVMDVHGRPSTSHVAHGKYPLVVGIGNPGHDSKGEHQQKMDWTIRNPVEGGGGADQHSPPRHPVYVQRPPRDQDRKRDEDGY